MLSGPGDFLGFSEPNIRFKVVLVRIAKKGRSVSDESSTKTDWNWWFREFAMVTGSVDVVPLLRMVSIPMLTFWRDLMYANSRLGFLLSWAMSSSNSFILCLIVDLTRARSVFSSAFDSVDIFLFLTARSLCCSFFF